MTNEEVPTSVDARSMDFTNVLWSSQKYVKFFRANKGMRYRTQQKVRFHSVRQSRRSSVSKFANCGLHKPSMNFTKQKSGYTWSELVWTQKFRSQSRYFALLYTKIHENLWDSQFDLWDSQFLKSWLRSPMSPTIVYHLCDVLPVVLEISQSVVSAKIHDLKKVPFWGGTMRRIGPRWRGRTYRLILFFAPNESSTRALSVGMLISIRECLNKKFQAFEHFSATK